MVVAEREDSESDRTQGNCDDGNLVGGRDIIYNVLDESLSQVVKAIRRSMPVEGFSATRWSTTRLTPRMCQ